MAAAAIAAGGSMYAADKGEKASRSSQEPGFLRNAESSALDKATAISNKPYTPYTGQRVADISGNEKQASQLARTGSDKALGYLDQAGSQLGKIQDYSKSALDQYTNPYVESVLTPQLRTANDTYQTDLATLQNSKAGAWGGDRSAFASSELERNHMNNVADITGKTYADAYTNAQNAFFADSDRHTRAAAAYQSLGGDVSKMNTEQIQDLMATGGTERLLSQANLDFDYQTFTENRDWDTHNLDPLLKAISASKGGNITTTDTGTSGAWGQAIGAAATVAGAYFTGGSNTQLDAKQTGKSTDAYINNTIGYPAPIAVGSGG